MMAQFEIIHITVDKPIKTQTIKIKKSSISITYIDSSIDIKLFESYLKIKITDLTIFVTCYLFELEKTYKNFESFLEIS